LDPTAIGHFSFMNSIRPIAIFKKNQKSEDFKNGKQKQAQGKI